MSLKALSEMSRRYGSDGDFVLAGGGNTSWKDGDILYVKASGYSLGAIREDGFARLDRKKLKAIWRRHYPEDKALRESEALSDLLAARVPGEAKRPSVESLLHDLFPQAYVAHMHPALVNGLTCGRDGEKIMKEVFPGEALWIPTVNPGYVLAKMIKDLTDAYVSGGNRFPSILFLQNHGVFVAGENPAEIDAVYGRIFDAVKRRVKRWPDISEADVRTPETLRRASLFQDILAGEMQGGACGFFINREFSSMCASREGMAPVSSAYTPDHIVYAGHAPLFLPWADREKTLRLTLSESLKAYREQWGVKPKTVVLEGTGAFSCMESGKAADTALLVFADAVKVSVFAESFGGGNFMPQDQIDFILTWEVEQYRAKVNEES